MLQNLNNTPDSFVAGKITNFWLNWTQVTSDKYLLDIVAKGFDIMFETGPCQSCSRNELTFNTNEDKIVDDLLQNFLGKKVVEPVNHKIGEVISHIFIRPKSDGSYRLILNLSNLNEHIEYCHFKMETLKHVLTLVKKDCFFAKIDLKDAYYSVPIAKDSRKYLRFTWKGILYEFTCLAQGLACAPRIYTKLLKPVFSSLRKQGHINVTYIDDSLLQSNTFEECSKNVYDTLTLVDSLGLTVHPDKSVIIPVQCIEFIGYLVNSVDMTVRLTPKKAKAIAKLSSSLLERESFTIREFAQLIGKMVASEQGVMYAPLYYKVLEIQKDHELKRSKGDFDSYMTLTQKSKDCLKWWIQNVETSFKNILLGPPTRKIESDSSSTGFGARGITNGQDISGIWTDNDKDDHINYLELKAAFMALKGLCGNVYNEHIQLFLDNTTAIKYLSKMGGRKAELNDLTRDVWMWCADRNIVLSVFHIPGRLNTYADGLSRQKLNEDMEWMLHTSIFNKIRDKFGPFDVDMFASCHNFQFCPYVLYLPDVNAMAINSFSLSWGQYFSFIFAPFSVNGAVLQKLEEDAAEAVVIAPLFASQPWFPRLLQMVTAHPLILPKSDNLLVHPTAQTTHPLKKMSLCAFKVSGKSWQAREFHQMLPISSCHLGDLAHRNNIMGRMCQNGCYFVVKDRYLHFNHL